MVTRSVLVIKRRFAQPVSKRVDTERRLQRARERPSTAPVSNTYMMDENQSQQTSIYVATHPVTPSKTSYQGWENDSHDEHQLEVVTVLPLDDIVLGQVTNVRHARLAARLQDHPTNMGPEQSFVGIIRVEVGVGVPVVSAVATGPPSDRTLDGTSTK